MSLAALNNVRDSQLDIYRSMAMIYMVCVVHGLYIFDLGSDFVRSVILFEMPVIFFIAGASAKIAGYENRSFTYILKSRIKRVMLPYYVYIFITLLISLIYNHVNGYSQVQFSAATIVKMLVGLCVPEMPITNHLWFIPVYFVISLSVYPQSKLLRKISTGAYLILLLLVFLMSTCIEYDMYSKRLIPQMLEVIKEVALYNIFFIAGIVYYKKIAQKMLFAMVLVAGLVFWIVTAGDITGMQEHKFMADGVFLVFGFFMLSIAFLFFSFVKVSSNRVLRRWGDCGFTIYLWQNWIFVTMKEIFISHGYKCSDGDLWWIIPTLFVLSTLLSFITVPIEKAGVRALRLLFGVWRGLKFVDNKRVDCGGK